MANYMGNSPSYSLFDDESFNTAWSNAPLRDKNQSELPIKEDQLISPSTASAGIKGAQAGGLSGALMAGGVNSLLTSGAAAGGPFAIAGGLLLSELQAAQEAKALAEAQKIENEKNRMANMQNQLNAQSRTVFKV